MSSPLKLTKSELICALKEHMGLIPIHIDIKKKEIIWSDLGEYHFYEGFFNKSLAVYFNINKNKIITYSTDLEILLDNTLIMPFIYPSGFIFHLGRSGSTLLSKILARNRNHLMISEAAPLNQFWLIFGRIKDFDKNENLKTIYKNLLLAILRRRLLSHTYSFIKFTSYNIHFFDFINSIFPDVPSIYLYKKPNDVISSFEQKPTGLLDLPKLTLESITGLTNPDIVAIVNKQMTEALDIQESKLKKVAYETLNPENLNSILKYFHIKTDNKQLKIMQSQFEFDSKVDFNKKKY
jgi:hypothetical protein